MGKMILGTVQLGMPYGVNNTDGKPGMQEAMNILDYAYHNGISMLDTASAYGNSEEIIGRYIKYNDDKSRFKICTKLPVDIEAIHIPDYYEQSRERLHVDIFDVYYLHRFEQCKNENILEQLNQLKRKGNIKNIGISVYQPDELEYIVDHLSDVVDVVQIPFSVFDNIRWIRNGLLAQAGKKGIKLYARSIFLQGLILADANSELCKRKGVTDQITKLQDIAKSMGSKVAQLAVDYINTVNGIESWLIGCETVKQLQENINMCKNTKHLEGNICNEIEKISNSIEEKVIDPRKWDS